MKMNATWLAGTLVALGLTTASWADPFNNPRPGGAEGPPPGEGREPGPGLGPIAGLEQAVLGRILNNAKIAAELGLTDAQVQTLRDGAFDIQEQRVKLKADMELAAIQQARLLVGETVDEKALMAAVEKTGDVRTELAKTEMRSLLLVRNTLTVEQRDKVREMMRKQMANRPRDERGFQRGDRQQRPGQERRERDGRGPGGHGGPGPEERPSQGDAPPPEAPPPPEDAPGE